ncbi:MFS transporter [Burkholderia guangdongensis]|uniref:MFS transporter n=1 Tax=Burkholderia guangdongensis TaxID=1792500 RepID=UPI0015C84D8D|nr:MFS transporter [Burkholderia guangdongensis]
MPTVQPENVGATRAVKVPFPKIDRHVLPLLTICYVIAFLDRINIGFAQLQMKQSLPFGDTVYATGAGIFFVGYLLFEVPSNLMLERIGARRTLLRIMVCWGCVACAMMFVRTPAQFYVLRFLLGVFEAGFFPGVILYLTQWYPGARRARAISIFMIATPLAGVIAGPLSGWIMKFMDGALDLHGWQWLFLVQGMPAPILGIVAYFLLADRPEHAKWLSDPEKRALLDLLRRETADRADTAAAGHGALRALVRDPGVYTLSFAYALFVGASYAIGFWMPTLINSWGVGDVFAVGVLAALPALAGAVGMVLIGRSSDRRQERRGHFLLAIGFASLGLLLTLFAEGLLVWSLASLAICSIGKSSMTPLFFTMVSEYVPKQAAAGGIALISSLGNVGPAIMPSITAWIVAAADSPVPGLLFLVTLYLVAGAIVLRATRSTAAAAAMPSSRS